MRFLLCGINAKYIHSNLAIFSLKAYADRKKIPGAEIILKEYTINNYVEDILQDLYEEKADVVIFSCYIWNISFVRELAAELKISAAAISTYKNRNRCGGILETLCQMQKEERENYFLDGRAVSYKELMQMGYTSVSYQTVPKKKIPLYPQLAGHDFVTGCVDVAKIYEEVKSERLEQEKGMQMNM